MVKTNKTNVKDKKSFVEMVESIKNVWKMMAISFHIKMQKLAIIFQIS